MAYGNRGGGGGNSSQWKRDKFGNAQTFCALYRSEKGPGLVGYFEIGSKRYQIFVTDARDRKKENHEKWATITDKPRPRG